VRSQLDGRERGTIYSVERHTWLLRSANRLRRYSVQQPRQVLLQVSGQTSMLPWGRQACERKYDFSLVGGILGHPFKRVNGSLPNILNPWAPIIGLGIALDFVPPAGPNGGADPYHPDQPPAAKCCKTPPPAGRALVEDPLPDLQLFGPPCERRTDLYQTLSLTEVRKWGLTESWAFGLD